MFRRRLPDAGGEPPQASAQAVEEPALLKQEPPSVEPQRSGPAPEPIRPQMRVDDLPRPALRPLPQRPLEKEKVADKPAYPVARHSQRPAEESSEPVDMIARRYEPRVYAAPMQPSAGVVVVAPGAQYGEDGIAIVNGRQDASWQLCQGSGHNRCIQYNYQPYGASGYRPLGSYRAYRTSPSYVYVPDAKVITID